MQDYGRRRSIVKQICLFNISEFLHMFERIEEGKRHRKGENTLQFFFVDCNPASWQKLDFNESVYTCSVH